jgi:hypothetical protein
VCSLCVAPPESSAKRRIYEITLVPISYVRPELFLAVGVGWGYPTILGQWLPKVLFLPWTPFLLSLSFIMLNPFYQSVRLCAMQTCSCLKLIIHFLNPSPERTTAGTMQEIKLLAFWLSVVSHHRSCACWSGLIVPQGFLRYLFRFWWAYTYRVRSFILLWSWGNLRWKDYKTARTQLGLP